MKYDLTLYAPMFSASGFGNHSRNTYEGLKELGWAINLISTERPNRFDNEYVERYKSVIGYDYKSAAETPCIHIQPPSTTTLSEVYNILFTTLESKTIHKGAVNRISLFDEVWVPCKMNLKAIKNAGLHNKKRFVIPEGVDLGLYNPAGKKLKLNIPGEHVIILYIGDWQQRKGIRQMIEAFYKCKTNTPMTFIMRVNYQGRTDEYAKHRVMMEYAQMKRKYKETKERKVKLIVEHWPESKLVKLIRASDIYMILSMGEAWSLTTTQAMACAKPVITTGFGGHTDYCNNKNSVMCKIEKFDRMEDQEHIFVDFYQDQLFAYPDIDDAAIKLKKLAENKKLRLKLGARARQTMTKKYQWRFANKKISERMKKILKTLGRFPQ